MGCFSGRTELTAEEATSYNLDIFLGYYKSEAPKVYKVHLKYSSDGIVSEQQFKHISKKLGLFELSCEYIQPVLNFYLDFKLDISHYILEKLLIFSIIQSSGSNEVKAELLFKVFSGGNEEVKREDMNKFFDLILEIFIKMLVKLKVSDFVNNLTQDDMKNYSFKLRSRKNYALDAIILNYFGERETINEKEFVEISVKSFSEDFYTGHGIRNFMKKAFTRKHSIEY